MPAYQMLKISKEEFDRLMETSPSIDGKVVKKFNKTFSGGQIRKDGNLEVIEGLEENDKIVKEGLSRLSKGMIVKPIIK